MKKTAIILTLLALMSVSCSTDYENEFDDVTAQTEEIVSDTTAENRGDVPSSGTTIGNRGDSITNVHTSVVSKTEQRSCRVYITSCLDVDGGKNTYNPCLRVTVRKVVVDIVTDSTEWKSNLALSAKVAEPDTVSWKNLPRGIIFDTISVIKTPVKIVYKKYFKVTVDFYYTVRIKDDHLEFGYFSMNQRKTVKYSSSSSTGETLSINCPIDLNSVSFDACIGN